MWIRCVEVIIEIDIEVTFSEVKGRNNWYDLWTISASKFRKEKEIIKFVDSYLWLIEYLISSDDPNSCKIPFF